MASCINFVKTLEKTFYQFLLSSVWWYFHSECLYPKWCISNLEMNAENAVLKTDKNKRDTKREGERKKKNQKNTYQEKNKIKIIISHVSRAIKIMFRSRHTQTLQLEMQRVPVTSAEAWHNCNGVNLFMKAVPLCSCHAEAGHADGQYLVYAATYLHVRKCACGWLRVVYFLRLFVWGFLFVCVCLFSCLFMWGISVCFCLFVFLFIDVVYFRVRLAS